MNLTEMGVNTVNQIRDAATDVARDAAAKVEDAMESVRDLDLVGKSTEYIKSNPTQAMLGAAAIGLFAGWMIRRS